MAAIIPLIFGALAVYLIFKVMDQRRHYAALMKMDNPVSIWYTVYCFFCKEVKKTTLEIFNSGIIMNKSNERGPLVMRFFGIIPYIAIYNAESVERLLKSKNINKSNEYLTMRPWLGNGLITNNGDSWRRNRKILTPTFHYDILNNYVKIFKHHSRIFVGKLDGLVAAGGKVEMTSLVCACALDVIYHCIVGRHFDMQNDPDSPFAKATNKVRSMARARMQTPWFWPETLFNLFGNGREQNKYLKVVHGYADRIIDEEWEKAQDRRNGNAPKETGEKTAFIHQILELVLDGEWKKSEVRQELDTFIFAGHDTTTLTVSYTLLCLAENPEMQEKAAAEIRSVVPVLDDIDTEKLKKLEYLECCLKETMRLYPPVPLMGRTVETELDMGDGLILPPGVQIGYCSFVIHRDPHHWADPDMFLPDRFLPANAAGRHPYAYIPFSAGARNCIGQKFGYLEAKTMLSFILSNFRVSAVQKRYEITTIAELVLTPIDGIHLRFQRRD